VSETKIGCSSYIPLFIIVMTVGLIFSNHLGFKDIALNATIYAQSDLSSLSPEELQQQAKDFLSTLMELQNQSSTNESSLVDENMGNATTSESDLAIQQPVTDVSGHYSNPSYGILDFVIPPEWYGSEKQWSGDKSISLDMHQGTEAEYQERLFSPPSADGVIENEPIMTLESNDKAQMQFFQSGLREEPLVAEIAPASQCKSLDGSIRFLEPNSTVTIDGKAFNVFTMECKWETDYGSGDEMLLGNLSETSAGSTMHGSSTEVSKTYRYESPERIYSLQLKVSKDLFSDSQNIPQNMIDIKKYTPIIDEAVKSVNKSMLN
jgi:hypothetical protein